MRLENETVLHAKNPKAGAQIFAHKNYIAPGERIDVLTEMGDHPLNYEVRRSRIDDGGCRVQYVGEKAWW
jgi:hypothetical protein